MLALLDKYIVHLEKAQEKTTIFLNFINNNACNFITSPDEICKHIQEYAAKEFSDSGKEIIDIQERMFKEMRQELGIDQPPQK